MAITIQSNPGTYFSVNGDLIFTVAEVVKTADPATYPDYRFVADVYVGAVLVTRLKAYPDPTTKIGVFNIGNILRSYIQATFSPDPISLGAQTMAANDFNITATVKFGEEYNFTLFTNITVDSARLYFGHYNGRTVGQLTNLSDKANKAATSRALVSPLRTDSRFNFIPFFQTGSAVGVSIKAYTAGGTLLGTTATLTGALSNILQIFNISVASLNASSPGFINTNVAGYLTVEFQGNGIIYRFNLNCEAKFEIFTLHFLNKWGGWESRDFSKVSRKTIDIEKSEFGKLGYTIDISGVVSYKNSNNVYNETKAVYSSQYKEKLTLNTDILTDSEYTWLGELILSPSVYIEQLVSGTTYFLPCAILSSNYEFRKVINDQLTNLQVEVEFGEQFNAQYR